MLLLLLFPFLCSEPPEPLLDSGLLPGRRLLAVRVTVLGGRTRFRHCMGGMRASVEWKLVPHWLAEKPATERRSPGREDMENNRHAPGSRPVGGDGRRFWLAHQVPP